MVVPRARAAALPCAPHGVANARDDGTAPGAALMRLAIIRLAYGAFGGAERVVDAAAAALGREGVEVAVLTTRWTGAADAAFAVRTIPARAATRVGRMRAFRRGVRDALASERFDLVQSHERLLGADLFRAGDGVHAAWLDRLAKTRGALGRLALRLDPFHRDVLAVERAMARDPALTFVAVSKLVEREIRERLGVAAERVVRVENGVDLARFAPEALAPLRADRRRALGVGDGEPLVLFVGSGYRRKGAAALVAALARPAMKDVRVAIVGKDRAPGRLAALAVRLGVRPRVVLAGPQEDVRPWFAAADAFALPSLYDPMPNAVLEALAAGLPVVTTPDTGAADAVAESDAGVVAPADPDAIAAGLARVLAGREAYAARARAASLAFDAGAATRRWLDLYRTLLARGRGR